MRSIIAGAILALILSLLLVISYLSPLPTHGSRVEMISKISPKTLERGINQTVYGIRSEFCNETYYIVEIHPMINESSLLILKVCFENNCKTYRKVLKESESLTFRSPSIGRNESLNVSISGSLISTTTNEKIEEGQIELKLIGFCE
ncbi:hypothetical protein [Archaeoglobus sp.]